MGIGVQGEAVTQGPPKQTPKRRLEVVSPSQVDAYRRCPRIWFNQQILRDREPSKPFFLKGDGIHKALEIFSKTGEVLPQVKVPGQGGVESMVVDTMEFVQVAIPHLSPPITNTEYWGQFPPEPDGRPSAALLIEQAGEMVTFEGGPSVVQYIDRVDALKDSCTITDYKTTSDFRYCKTPEELRENTQLIWNARWVFMISDYKEIEIRHLYLLTKSARPKAKPVSAIVTREDVERVWQRDMATVREMVSWAALSPPTAEPLPPNTDSCDMYGGCYYRTKCGFDVATVGWRKKEPMSEPQKTNGLLAQLLQQAQAANPKPPAVAPAEPAAAPAAPAAPAGVTVFAAPDADKPLSLAEMLARQAPAAPESPAAPATGVVPPDAPPPTSTEAEVAAANPVEAPAAEAAAEDTGGQEAAAETPKKRGRPRKNQGTPEQSAPAADTEVAAVVAEAPFQAGAALDESKTNEGAVPTETPQSVLGNVEQLRTILMTPDSSFDCGCEVLFVDSLPTKGWIGEQPVDLSNIMHAFERVAAQSAKKADYRLISYEAKGYLAQAVRVMMKGLPKTITMDSRSPGADVFLSVVTPYCKMIFKGAR